MVKIDTLSFELPADIARCNDAKFKTKQVTTNKETGESFVKHIAGAVMRGLKTFDYIPAKNIIHIELSGKILPIEHRQLITAANFAQVIDTINSTGYCELNVSDVAEYSIVRKVDFTENIEARAGAISNYMQALSVINNPKYKTEEYIGKGIYKGKTGVVMKGKQKTVSEHLLTYDKAIEAKNDAYNGIIRLESKRSSFQSIRNDVNGDNNLHDIFATENKPVLALFRKIVRGHTGGNLFRSDADSAMSYLYAALLELRSGNTDAIKTELKDICRSRATALRHHRRILKLQASGIAGVDYMKYINDIGTQLAEL